MCGMSESPLQFIKTEKRGRIFLIGFNRPAERNAFNTQMLLELAQAFTMFEDDPDVWAALIYGEGKHFTLGLELNDVAGTIKKERKLPLRPGQVDPWNVSGRLRKKPVIVAAHGMCITLGIELMLASEIRIAASRTMFSQMEVQRGILPFGGATMRFVSTCGYGNAMRYMLTGDLFEAPEALRIGLVQEIVDKDKLIQRGLELADSVSSQAPLAVQATMASSQTFLRSGFDAAAGGLVDTALALMETEDAAEGVASFVEKRKAVFKGR